jgi:hypothetical protein
MEQKTKKYSFGNMGESLRCADEYLGWVPIGYNSWDDFHWKHFGNIEEKKQELPLEIIISKGEFVEQVIISKFLSKDAIHMSSFTDEHDKIKGAVITKLQDGEEVLIPYTF